MSSTTPLYDPPRFGGDCLASCTKCKMDLAHVIVAMIDNKPAKVICKTCKSQHKYKRLGTAEAIKKASKPRAARKTAATETVRVAELWEQKMAENKEARSRMYSPQATFLKGDVIEHPKFGMGFVQEVRLGNKVAVLFRDEEKVLVHSMAPPAPQ